MTAAVVVVASIATLGVAGIVALGVEGAVDTGLGGTLVAGLGASATGTGAGLAANAALGALANTGIGLSVDLYKGDASPASVIESAAVGALGGGLAEVATGPGAAELGYEKFLLRESGAGLITNFVDQESLSLINNRRLAMPSLTELGLGAGIGAAGGLLDITLPSRVGGEVNSAFISVGATTGAEELAGYYAGPPTLLLPVMQPM